VKIPLVVVAAVAVTFVAIFLQTRWMESLSNVRRLGRNRRTGRRLGGRRGRRVGASGGGGFEFAGACKPPGPPLNPEPKNAPKTAGRAEDMGRDR